MVIGIWIHSGLLLCTDMMYSGEMGCGESIFCFILVIAAGREVCCRIDLKERFYVLYILYLFFLLVYKQKFVFVII